MMFRIKRKYSFRAFRVYNTTTVCTLLFLDPMDSCISILEMKANRLSMPAGDTVVDVHGYKVVTNGKPFREGMVMRANLDGSNVEVLGNNFRNNFEVAVDPYGTLWQSDNDDDGNKGTRINYVMEYGNFGYRDEMTGASWSARRTNMEKEIPLRHWHLNDPGVVPNILQTGGWLSFRNNCL